jgi:hypothetical protein
MKNKIMVMAIICLFVMTVFVVAEEEQEEQPAELQVVITTDQNIDALIVENSDGDIDNTIICNGGTCTTNVQGGTISVPEGQTFNYNEYKTEYVTKHGGGLGISEINERLAGEAQNYNNRTKKFGSSYWYDFWGLLDSIFVSHREFQPVSNNVNFLADKIDKLEAENTMLMQYLNLTFVNETLECRTALNKAHRIGMEVKTVNGWIADPETFGEQCIKIISIETNETEVNTTAFNQSLNTT